MFCYTKQRNIKLNEVIVYIQQWNLCKNHYRATSVLISNTRTHTHTHARTRACTHTHTHTHRATTSLPMPPSLPPLPPPSPPQSPHYHQPLSLTSRLTKVKVHTSKHTWLTQEAILPAVKEGTDAGCWSCCWMHHWQWISEGSVHSDDTSYTHE